MVRLAARRGFPPADEGWSAGDVRERRTDGIVLVAFAMRRRVAHALARVPTGNSMCFRIAGGVQGSQTPVRPRAWWGVPGRKSVRLVASASGGLFVDCRLWRAACHHSGVVF